MVFFCIFFALLLLLLQKHTPIWFNAWRQQKPKHAHTQKTDPMMINLSRKIHWFNWRQRIYCFIFAYCCVLICVFRSLFTLWLLLLFQFFRSDKKSDSEYMAYCNDLESLGSLANSFLNRWIGNYKSIFFENEWIMEIAQAQTHTHNQNHISRFNILVYFNDHEFGA